MAVRQTNTADQQMSDDAQSRDTSSSQTTDSSQTTTDRAALASSDSQASSTSDNGATATRAAVSSDAQQSDEHVYIADLNALNNSGVDGFAIINTQADGSLTVNIVADGLEADQPHAQHIHGFVDGKDSETPTIQQDADGDGFVELAEGQTTYGPILLNLTSPPTDPSAAPGGTFAGTPNPADFPTAPGGEENFSETYTFNAEDGAALLKTLGGLDGLDKNEIVLHGETVDAGTGSGTGGEVDGSAGYKGVLPVASGEIQEVTGLSAQVALNLLENAGSDPTSDELASTFYTVQALQAFAAARDDADCGCTGSTADTHMSAASTTASTTSDDTQSMSVASQDHQSDMMFA